jgi:hypothetical protein
MKGPDLISKVENLVRGDFFFDYTGATTILRLEFQSSLGAAKRRIPIKNSS